MRLSGQAKAGFFPTPHEIMTQLFDIVNIQGSCRILDTCAGEGYALRDFKDKYPEVTTYGVQRQTQELATQLSLAALS